MTRFFHPLDHVEARAEQPFKTTFFRSGRLLIGLNVLGPGQVQSIHEHTDQDKFYFVLSGSGVFTVDAEVRIGSAGDLIVAPAGAPHGVNNTGQERLAFLTIIAPAPA